MAPELALGGLQRWLQAVIEAPGPVTRALASREAARLVRPGRTRDVVLPSARLTAAERVGVYQAMYLPRMLDALESDYPGLAHFLGHAAWQRLVRAYISAHPSHSYTLNVLGRHLPEFVRGARVRRPAFCHDLARLESAVAEVFDAPETPSLAERDLAAVAPGDWERARLVPVAALRLVALDHDAGAWLDSLRDEAHRHPRVERRRSFLTVYRRNYAVMRREQTPAAFALLGDLVAGEPVGRAVARALGRRGAARLDGADTAFRLFREWAAMGVFQRVERERAGRASRGASRHPRPLDHRTRTGI
jgi:hypothetical protein